MNRCHKELLHLPLKIWSLIELEEHRGYLRELLSFNPTNPKEAEEIINDCLKLDAHIDLIKINKYLFYDK